MDGLVNESLWFAVTENINEGILVNVDGQHVYANRRICEMLGYAAGELVGTTIADVVHPEALNTVLSRFRKRVEGNAQPAQYETVFITRGGEKLPVELSATVMQYHGQTAGLVTIRDLTEQKRHERELARSSRLLEYFFHDADSGFALLDRDYNFIEVNSAFAQILGKDPEQCRGLNYFEFFSVDNRPLFDRVRDQRESAQVKSEPLVTILDDNYTTSYWNWSLTPIRDEMGNTEVLAISRYDITEQTVTKIALQMRERELLKHRMHLEELVDQRTRQLSESEQRFRAMADSAPALIWMTDKNNQWEWFNRSMLRYTGLALSEAMENGWEFLIHPQDRDDYIKSFSQAVVERKKFKSEFRIKRTNGTFGWIASIGIPRFALSNAYEGFIGYCWDITDVKMAEFEMAAAREEAEKANMAKSEFLSRMSHELRTPLNAVLGFAQLMLSEKDELNESQQDNVTEILKAGTHLLDLIGDILDLSRIEAGGLNLAMGQVDLETLMLESLSLVTPLADKRGIHVSFSDAHITGQRVYADNMRLKQVLLNLLSNAVKYNRLGGEVSVFCLPAQENRIRINVRDTGIGISAKDMLSLFLPFNRLGADAMDIEGTGIGLVIAKRMMEMMGGTIGVESEPGQGSTFWIELALYCNDVADDTRLPMRSVKVLYVENDAANVRMLERILAPHNHVSLLSVGNADDAASVLAAAGPDIIIARCQDLEAADSLLRQRLLESADSSAFPALVVVGAETDPLPWLSSAVIRKTFANPCQLIDILPLIDELVDSNV